MGQFATRAMVVHLELGVLVFAQARGARLVLFFCQGRLGPVERIAELQVANHLMAVCRRDCVPSNIAGMIVHPRCSSRKVLVGLFWV